LGGKKDNYWRNTIKNIKKKEKGVYFTLPAAIWRFIGFLL
jgi:hypothetical protein